MNIKVFFTKVKSFFDDKIINPFKENITKPNFLAMSVAVGTFCTLLPIFVFQQYLCLFIWGISKKIKALSFSLIIALAITLITNPATLPFVLYAYYMVGVLFTGDKIIAWSEFLHRIESIVSVRNESAIDALIKGFGFAFDEIGTPVILGCSISVIIITPLAYLLTYLVVYLIKEKKGV